jgi:heme exporter protein D
METIAQFLSMGGYAAFVWPAYGVGAAVMIGLLAQTLKNLHAQNAELAALGDAPDLRGPGQR